MPTIIKPLVAVTLQALSVLALTCGQSWSAEVTLFDLNNRGAGAPFATLTFTADDFRAEMSFNQPNPIQAFFDQTQTVELAESRWTLHVTFLEETTFSPFGRSPDRLTITGWFRHNSGPHGEGRGEMLSFSFFAFPEATAPTCDGPKAHGVHQDSCSVSASDFVVNTSGGFPPLANIDIDSYSGKASASHTRLSTDVPEPASAFLLGIGLAALTIHKRRAARQSM